MESCLQVFLRTVTIDCCLPVMQCSTQCTLPRASMDLCLQGFQRIVIIDCCLSIMQI